MRFSSRTTLLLWHAVLTLSIGFASALATAGEFVIDLPADRAINPTAHKRYLDARARELALERLQADLRTLERKNERLSSSLQGERAALERLRKDIPALAKDIREL